MDLNSYLNMLRRSKRASIPRETTRYIKTEMIKDIHDLWLSKLRKRDDDELDAAALLSERLIKYIEGS